MRKILGGLILLAMLMLALPAAAPAQVSVGVAVHIGPPALPVYEQPLCPGPGYLWTPGYWAYGDDGYYWVPGTWVIAPAVGLLWTPGYWGWGGGAYVWHAGYWGPHVGFYGGINYGFGYGGVGFVGGRWEHGVFAYNTAVMRVDTRVIHNTYVNRTVINNVTVNRVSYNGGAGGITARASSSELAAEREHHIPATHLQAEHEHSARMNRELRASENHGRPSIAATARPGEFKGHGAVAAAHSESPRGGGNAHENNAVMHKSDRPPSAHGGGNGPSNASHGNNPQLNSAHMNNAHGNNSQANGPHVNNAHGNNSQANGPHMNSSMSAPKNQPHPENRPHAENKPHEGGGKPH